MERTVGGRTVLRGVSLVAEAGEVSAIAGGSGSGKTTLLDTLAGIRPPSAGEVRHDGGRPDARGLGYVPQDDILHRALPLAHSLRYAAALRAPADEGPADAVDRTLAALGLTACAGRRVGTLSGGERKRASIAVELLTRPRVLFLDEPTSGLDPAAAAELMSLLHELARAGTTVVLTTHAPADLARCDRVAFLAPDGRPAYVGDPRAMCAHFGVATEADVYAAVASRGASVDAGREPELQLEPELGALEPELERNAGPGGTSGPAAESVPGSERAAETRPAGPKPAAVRGPGPARGAGADHPLRQWSILARRDLELITRDRLTAAMLIGSPLVIVAMFAMLFRPGAFDPLAPSPSGAAMILFWIAFGGFFFGLTYGLLQICVELPIVRRERLSVLRIGPYLAAKFTVLLPILVLADVVLLAVLRGMNRLPAASWSVYGSLLVTLLLASAAALALGLLTSAAVTEVGQATLMLPLLCFPQVLFSGAFVPVPRMPTIGYTLSYAMTNRWAFEALGSDLDLSGRWAHSRSPLGPPLLASYGDSFDHSPLLGWAVLAGCAALFVAATCAVLARRCPRAGW
ncbi:ABC transporter ATP-binding protein/permease [Embleya hyalina]|uniref:ABC transporter ATP-binding protein/permease n=1 Tax=Embleya hyalina TaxID=516124 RepID=UPI001FE808D8|nr:ATP-binding cassette domain-containing protein [Embleya hyalina]